MTDVHALTGLPARAEHFDRVVSSDCELFDRGRLVFRFLKGALTPAASGAGRAAYSDVTDLEPPSLSRRAAAGLLDVETFRTLRPDVAGVIPVSPTSGHLQLTSGKVLKQVMSNPVASYLAGYSYSRFGQQCTIGRLTRRYPQKWETAQPLFRELDAVLARELPAVHARHVERCALHPHWRIPGTALSTVTINVNYESRYHRDAGDFLEGYSTLTVVALGRYDGGLFVLPACRVAIDVREGDVLLCQSHVDLHGNTPVEPLTAGARRLSFVTYLKHKLAQGLNRLETPCF